MVRMQNHISEMLKKGCQSLRHLSTLQDINQEIEFEMIWPFSKIYFKGEVKVISQATLTTRVGGGTVLV